MRNLRANLELEAAETSLRVPLPKQSANGTRRERAGTSLLPVQCRGRLAGTLPTWTLPISCASARRPH